MNSKIVKAVTALVFVAVAVAIVMLMTNDVKGGLETAGQKGFFALEVVLLLYALLRVFVLVRDIIRR